MINGAVTVRNREKTAIATVGCTILLR